MPARKKAAEPPAEGDYATNEVTAAEVNDHEYRKPIRPTKARIKEAAYAVIMLAWYPFGYGDDPDAPADRDFEPFDDEEEARKYFLYQDAWALQDFSENRGSEEDELHHATILLTDTDPENLVIDSIEVRGGSATWIKAVKAHFKANPEAIFSKTRADRIKENVEAAKAVKKPAKKAAPVKSAAAPKKAEQEYTDEELASMSLEEAQALPPGLKGRALALRSKKRRAEQAAKPAAQIDAPDDDTEPTKPTPSKRSAAAPKKVGAKKAPAKKITASAFVGAGNKAKTPRGSVLR